MKVLSANSNGATRVFRFDEFLFDASEQLLYRNGEVIQLPPKTCELLGAFLQNSGKLLSKEDLMNLVWKDTFVEEANLTHHIAVLRKTFGESNKFIQTIPRKGYKFIADLNETDEITLTEKTSTAIIEETIIEPEIVSGKKAVGELSGRRNNYGLWLTSAVLLILLAIGGFFGWRNFSAAKTDAPSKSEVKIKRLTPDQDAYAPAISPDGKSFIFAKLENFQETFWRKDIATGAMTELLPAHSVKDEFAIEWTRFSPDGRWIYYKVNLVSPVESLIFRIGSSGGAPEKIAGDTRGGDFWISPDEKQIVFGREGRIITVDLETKQERILVKNDDENFEIYSGKAFSADGKRLFYCGAKFEGERETFQLWELNLETGAKNQIPLPEDFFIKEIEPLKDSDDLIISGSDGKSFGLRIWRMTYPSGEMRRISNESDRLGLIRLSADSQKIITQADLGSFNLWTAPVDNPAQKRQITLGAAALHGNQGVIYTPNGRIIYTSVEGKTDLWMADADGGNAKQLTVNAGKSNYFPEATKDGRYLVFVSNRSGTDQIWRTDEDGRNPVQLSRGGRSWDCNLTPEGDVYYTQTERKENLTQIYRVPVTGGEPVLVNDFYYDVIPWFSADGKWMLFYGGVKREEKLRFNLVERATGKIVRSFDKMIHPLRWMPDSKAIVYRNALQSLVKQPIEGGEPQPFADFRPNMTLFFDFSADGKNMVFSSGNSTNEVVLIEDFQ